MEKFSFILVFVQVGLAIKIILTALKGLGVIQF